jgi:hypothetical protein
MTAVFVVSGRWGFENLYGIFSTREKAEAYVLRNPLVVGTGADFQDVISEFELDAPLEGE